MKKIASVLLLPVVWCGLSGPLPGLFAAERGTSSTRVNVGGISDTISMSFDGALLKDVLLLFSQQSGLNFVASQEVEGKKVTVYFENVTPSDALDSIMTANGLTYSKKPGSDIYVVYQEAKQVVSGPAMITKVVRLKYMRLSSSPLDVGGDVTIGDLKTSSSGTSGLSSSSSGSSASSSSSSSSGATSTDKGADRLVSKLLTAQGKLAVDIHTNSLIITDVPDNVSQIERILGELDVPAPQTVLEVYVMEINKELTSDIGVDWGGTSGAFGAYTAGAQSTAFPFRNVEKIFGDNFQPITGTAATSTLAAGTALPTRQMTLGTLDAANFKATLRMMISDSKTKVLARPRVLTQNNEAATIKLVTNQTTFQSETTNAVGNAGATTSTTNERTEVGVVLRMTPQINGDESVDLFLEPAVTTVALNSDFADTFDPTTRLVRTMARVKDNQTLVIGGLFNGNEQFTRRKLPILGDLPLVGGVFRYDAAINKNRELVIFVTPHIVHGSDSLGQRSATAKGPDVRLRRLLREFKDSEMNELTTDLQDYEKTKSDFYITDRQLIRASERRASNPLMDKQMSQALDALSPELVDSVMNQSLDSLSKKH